MRKNKEICKVILPKTDIETELIKIYPRAIDKDTYMERITGKRGGERGYRLYGSEDKTVYPSVTTILQSLSKMALPNWYAKKVAEKAGKIASEQTIQVYKSDAELDAFIKDIKSAPRDEFISAGKIGTEVHDLINKAIRYKMDNPYTTCLLYTSPSPRD